MMGMVGAGRVLLVGVVVAWSPASNAQEVCYSYDELGRVTGVIDQSNEAAFYEYDPVGNILSIRRQSPTGPVTVYSFDPTGGLPGDRVEVFGVGFSSTASENVVSIGGVQATVVSVAACTLVIEVPAGDVSGPIAVTTPLGTGVSSQKFNPASVTIAPTPPAILIGTTLQLMATLSECSDARLLWKVNGITGGNSTVGTIGPTGFYRAPGAVPASSTVIIRVESVGCVGIFAERAVAIVSELLGYVFSNASAQFGIPDLAFSAGTISHSASVALGVAPIGFAPGVVIQSASVAKAPVILAVSPNSAAKGSSFTLTVTGTNLAGAFALAFALATGQDPAITVTNVSVSPGGGALTANVSIAATAATGTRVVIVKVPSGNSTSVNTGADSFSVGP